MLSFVPLLFLMDTEIRHEALIKGKKVNWNSWGTPPEESESSYEKYKKQLKGRRR